MTIIKENGVGKTLLKFLSKRSTIYFYIKSLNTNKKPPAKTNKQQNKIFGMLLTL